MKIALPSLNNVIDHHFGHCESFTLYTVDPDQKKILKQETLLSPQGCGCKSNIATLLAENGVRLMLAGNMGTGAVKKLNASGIQVIRGCSGDLEDVAKSWLQGQIEDNHTTCDSHECHHD